MKTDSIKTGVDETVLSKFRNVPVLSAYAQSRGWYFVISWCHRITGLGLVGIVWIRILSMKHVPNVVAHNASEQSFFVSLSLWLLAIPVILHGLNGGRLVLYESFGRRNDDVLMRWVAGLSIVYLAILGLLMAVGDQYVSLFFYWLVGFVCALVLGYGVAAKVWSTRHSIFWKMQRISGAFLLVMVPAYILFLNLGSPLDAMGSPMISRMAIRFVSVVYMVFLVAALLHGAYGLWSTVSDYISSQVTRVCSIVLITLVTLVFTWVGISLTLSAW